MERGDRPQPNPGRGFNLFKALRRVFRASAACGGLVDAVVDRVAALRRASVRTPVSRRAMERGDRAQPNPGRGINLFKALRRVFRASVACGGLVDAVVDRVTALRRASVRTPVSRRAMERGYRARQRGLGATEPRARERRVVVGGRIEPGRLRPGPFGGEGAAVAVELAHDLHHLVDRLEVCGRHGAEGDQHRLVEAADLNGHELFGRVRHAASEPRI